MVNSKTSLMKSIKSSSHFSQSHNWKWKTDYTGGVSLLLATPEQSLSRFQRQNSSLFFCFYGKVNKCNSISFPSFRFLFIYLAHAFRFVRSVFVLLNIKEYVEHNTRKIEPQYTHIHTTHTHSWFDIKANNMGIFLGFCSIECSR